MPYYHVRIAKKNGKTKWAFAFDLSKSQLMNEIVTPFLKGQQFMCERSVVRSSEIEYIGINETDQPSSDILKKTRPKRLLKAFIGGSPRPYSLRAEAITSAGKDITRELIKDLSLNQETKTSEPRKAQVFIVHGKDHKPLKELKAILEEVGLEPIVLHEKASGSRTIVEKLEKYSDVGYTFVILTPDDAGTSIEDLYEEERVVQEYETGIQIDDDMGMIVQRRARQNVILEFGYFIGLLGRDRVCCLHKGNVELPSDMHGIVYVHFNESINEAKSMIVKELREAGYEIKA